MRDTFSNPADITELRFECRWNEEDQEELSNATLSGSMNVHNVAVPATMHRCNATSRPASSIQASGSWFAAVRFVKMVVTVVVSKETGEHRARPPRRSWSKTARTIMIARIFSWVSLLGGGVLVLGVEVEEDREEGEVDVVGDVDCWSITGRWC